MQTVPQCDGIWCFFKGWNAGLISKKHRQRCMYYLNQYSLCILYSYIIDHLHTIKFENAQYCYSFSALIYSTHRLELYIVTKYKTVFDFEIFKYIYINSENQRDFQAFSWFLKYIFTLRIFFINNIMRQYFFA